MQSRSSGEELTTRTRNATRATEDRHRARLAQTGCSVHLLSPMRTVLLPLSYAFASLSRTETATFGFPRPQLQHVYFGNKAAQTGQKAIATRARGSSGGTQLEANQGTTV